MSCASTGGGDEMPRLEYRINDKGQGCPIVYFYESMDDVEAAMRFICDYFVKEGKTYLKTATAVEPACFVVYVEAVEDDAAEDGNAVNPLPPAGIAVEVREYQEGAEKYPLIHQFAFNSQVQAFSHLLADTISLFGQAWEKTSTEIDEDRQAYVYYCRKVKE
jgi:hypothetical protein